MHSKTPIPDGLRPLWGLEVRGSRGPGARYTARQVAEAAVALADEAGLAAITLGAVASRLSLTTTALYRYVETKDVLVEMMVDTAFGEPPAPSGADWRERARAWAYALAKRYRAHPWLVMTPASGAPRRPGVYAWLDAFVCALDDAPDTLDRLRLGLALDAVVRGLAPALGTDGPPPPWLLAAVRERHPRLASLLVRDWSDVDDEVAAAVELVLAGASVTAPAAAAE